MVLTQQLIPRIATDVAELVIDISDGALRVGGAVNRPGSRRGSGYWISTRCWSVRFVA